MCWVAKTPTAPVTFPMSEWIHNAEGEFTQLFFFFKKTEKNGLRTNVTSRSANLKKQNKKLNTQNHLNGQEGLNVMGAKSTQGTTGGCFVDVHYKNAF